MIESTFTGPLFTGALTLSVDRATKEAEDAVAQRAVNLIRDRLHDVLQHPTGYYESNIQTDRTSEGAVVTDGGVIYGPWLEGVGSRNQTTRFKGYGTFRLVAQQINDEALAVTEPIIAKSLEV